MKGTNLKVLSFLLLFGLIFLSSCNKDFGEFMNEQFPELSNTSDDIYIDGELAVPLVNTHLTLSNFIPSSDSSLWAEVDDQDLVHIRMYLKEIVNLSASDIYGLPIVSPQLPDSSSLSTEYRTLKLYEKAIEGKLFFNDPRFTFIVKNEIPIVTFFKIDTLRLSTADMSATYVRSNIKHYIDAPTVQGESAETSILIDKNEIPDFQEFFSPIPKFVSFFVTTGNDQVQTFPSSFSTVTGSEKLTVDLDIDLPAEARLLDLVMADTIPFSVDSLNNFEEITSVKIKLFLENEFAAGGIAQIAFVDTNAAGEIQDTLMLLFDGDGFEFNPATVVTETSNSPVTSEIVKEISQTDLQKLKDGHVSKILIISKLNTFESHSGTVIKLYGYQQLGVKLGLKVTYGVSSSGL